ncbi:MAG: hypothetical protein ACFE0O_08105 [Opitutales bacterium]
MTLSVGERILVFVLGLVGGLILLGIIERLRVDPETGERPTASESLAERLEATTGLSPLPEGSPEALRRSALLAFEVVEIPGVGPRRVWLLELAEGPHPVVRVWEAVPEPAVAKTPAWGMMAGDRVLVRPGAEADANAGWRQAIEAVGYRVGRKMRGLEGWEVFIPKRRPLAIPVALDRLQRIGLEAGFTVEPYPVTFR